MEWLDVPDQSVGSIGGDHQTTSSSQVHSKGLASADGNEIEGFDIRRSKIFKIDLLHHF